MVGLVGAQSNRFPRTRPRARGAALFELRFRAQMPVPVLVLHLINMQGGNSQRRSSDDIERLIGQRWADGIRRFFITGCGRRPRIPDRAGVDVVSQIRLRDAREVRHTLLRRWIGIDRLRRRLQTIHEAGITPARPYPRFRTSTPKRSSCSRTRHGEGRVGRVRKIAALTQDDAPAQTQVINTA